MNRELTPQMGLFAGGFLVLVGGAIAAAAGVVNSFDPFIWTFIGASFAGISLDQPGGRVPPLPRAGLILVGGVALGVVQALQLGDVQFVAEVVAVLPYVGGMLDCVAVLGAEN
jgi:hypothetical protein